MYIELFVYASEAYPDFAMLVQSKYFCFVSMSDCLIHKHIAPSICQLVWLHFTPRHSFTYTLFILFTSRCAVDLPVWMLRALLHSSCDPLGASTKAPHVRLSYYDNSCCCCCCEYSLRALFHISFVINTRKYEHVSPSMSACT